jgi:hypothetical protein
VDPGIISFTLLLQFYFYSYCLLSCILLPFTTRYAQSFVYNKPVRLTTSSYVGAKYLVVLCVGSTLLLVKSRAPAFIWRHCWSVAKLAGINLRKCGSFSYWFDNLGFTTEERLAAVLIIPSSWGSQQSVIYTPSAACIWSAR